MHDHFVTILQVSPLLASTVS